MSLDRYWLALSSDQPVISTLPVATLPPLVAILSISSLTAAEDLSTI
jgi:hypothetical protein